MGESQNEKSGRLREHHETGATPRVAVGLDGRFSGIGPGRVRAVMSDPPTSHLSQLRRPSSPSAAPALR